LPTPVKLLLHRENFFQDLEFFEKESISNSSFQKLQHRLNRVDEREVKKASKAALGLLHWLEAIAGFSTTYSKMLPIIKELETAESDLGMIQRELGRARVSLDTLKNDFDEVDALRSKQTELVQNLKHSLRHQNSKLEAMKTFLETLTFCTEKWSKDLEKLKYSRSVSAIETMISVIQLFIIARYPAEISQKMIKQLNSTAQKSFKLLQDFRELDINQYFVENLGFGSFLAEGSPHQIHQKYLDTRNIEYSTLNWTEDPENFPSDLIINKIQDLKAIKNEWLEMVCQTQFQDYSKQQNIHKWNEEMILKEISDLEDRLFADIIVQEKPLVELSYLKKIVQKRKKAKFEWQNTFIDNKSLAQEQVLR
jgi:hypothetical protein